MRDAWFCCSHRGLEFERQLKRSRDRAISNIERARWPTGLVRPDRCRVGGASFEAMAIALTDCECESDLGLVSSRASALVQPLVLAATPAAVGYGRDSAGARAFRRVASTGTRARPRLRDGNERGLPGAARLGGRRRRLRRTRDRESTPSRSGCRGRVHVGGRRRDSTFPCRAIRPCARHRLPALDRRLRPGRVRRGSCACDATRRDLFAVCVRAGWTGCGP
jgi:hypothetical protein